MSHSVGNSMVFLAPAQLHPSVLLWRVQHLAARGAQGLSSWMMCLIMFDPISRDGKEIHLGKHSPEKSKNELTQNSAHIRTQDIHIQKGV